MVRTKQGEYDRQDRPIRLPTHSPDAPMPAVALAPEERLVADGRGSLTPSEVVAGKLQALLRAARAIESRGGGSGLGRHPARTT
jgi:hypothetical protein